MPFPHDSSGYEPKNFSLLPDGWYPFKIYEAEEMKSKKGLDMVLVKAEVFNDDRYKGKTVWNYVTFFKDKEAPGFGISVHFRKSIGVAFGGNDMVDADEWVGKKFMGKIVTEEFDGKTRNKFKEISPYREGLAPLEEPLPAATEVSDESVPF